MNHGFRSRFDQLRENDPTPATPSGDERASDHYPASAHVRNLGLIWPDGRRMFFNYAYLMAGEFDVGGEKNQIKLTFSSHTVLLRGYQLAPLFMALLEQLPRLILVTDPRYVSTEDNNEALVVEIQVEQKGD